VRAIAHIRFGFVSGSRQFLWLDNATREIETWRRHDDGVRPHSSSGGLTLPASSWDIINRTTNSSQLSAPGLPDQFDHVRVSALADLKEPPRSVGCVAQEVRGLAARHRYRPDQGLAELGRSPDL
jgi:hypothetical protein